MDFVLWHNIISIHQAPFVRELSNRYDVLLVVEQEINKERFQFGWQVPNMGNARIIVAPSGEKIKELISKNSNATHFFTGITAFPLIYKAFKEAIRQRVQVFIHMEPYENRGWRAYLRFLHYRYLCLKYKKYISAILATGKSGVRCYLGVGFSHDKIFEWGYFTNMHYSSENYNYFNNSEFKIIFIGRLDVNKQVISLISAIKNIINTKVHLMIVGNGELQKEVEQQISNVPNIQYIGCIPNDAVANYLLCSDLLVLPSLYDGWGAVVNEALTLGVRVLCSSSCGASCLLDDISRGSVFSWEKEGDFEKHLNYWIARGPMKFMEKENIRTWASQHISAKSAVDYVSSIKQYLSSSLSAEKPLPPWKSESDVFM